MNSRDILDHGYSSVHLDRGYVFVSQSVDVSSEERNKESPETFGIRYLIIIGVDKSSNNIGAKLC